MRGALAFLAGSASRDYGSRLARLRWRRAAGLDCVADWDPAAPAPEAVAGADSWVVVRATTALPIGVVPEPIPGRLLLAEKEAPASLLFVHTLRELEEAEPRAGPGSGDPLDTPALVFRSADFPGRTAETVGSFVNRLLTEHPAHVRNPPFRVLCFDDTSGDERPELTRRLPPGSLRILDVGCGAGGSVARGKARNTGWHVTGIEKDPRLARAARARCDRVLEGDLAEILPRLAEGAERFDALVFADVLEHLEDPVEALRIGRRLAAPGATLLVSVPNVGHLSLVRDLLAGRFDPVPAGLSDVGHLRWFTKHGLTEALVEAGWLVISVEGEAGAPPPDPGPFLVLAAGWPEGDRESLMTYQWIAVGRNDI